MIEIICLILVGLVVAVGARFLYKSWWYPISLQHLMNSQGVKGPPYRYPNGNAEEIREMEMKLAASSNPKEISHDVFRLLQPHFHTWMNLYGKTFFYWAHSSQPQLVVTDADLIKEILLNKDDSFGKMKLEGITKKFIGDGSVFQEGQKWSKLRKVSDHVFHVQNVKDMFPEVVASAEEMLETWKSKGEEIEVHEEFRVLSSELIAKAIFGSNFSTGKEIFHMLDKIAYICMISYGEKRTPIIDKLFKSTEEVEADKVLDVVGKLFKGIINQRQDRVKTGQSKNFGDDFLGSLLEGHFKSGDKESRITMEEIIEECKTFYFAGHETVNSLLAWCVLLIATHQDWQDKARNEVLEVMGHENPKPDSVSRLKTMSMIMNETLRLYPPLILLIRKVKRDTRLGKIKVPKGIEVVVDSVAVHHTSDLWGEDTHLFKPERFSEGVAKATRDQVMSFLAFGFGPRKCVGSNFANIEAKIALSMILQRYKFTVSPNYNHFPISMSSLRPRSGIQIMFHPL